MTSGDLVQISFDTPAGLATRTAISMSLIPETGAPVAAILINTTGSLQQRVQRSGKMATQEVSSNLKVFNVYVFFYNTTSTTLIYTLSLHDALPISTSLDLTKLILRYSDGPATDN